MSLLLNSSKMFFLSSFPLMKMFPMSINFMSSVLSLCTCNVMRWLRRLSFMVPQRYVLTLLRDEKDLSLIALDAGITNRSLTTFITSESKVFLARLRLLNFFKTSEIFISPSDPKEIGTSDNCLSSRDLLMSSL